MTFREAVKVSAASPDAALPHLRAQGGGRIIQMSIWGGQATGPGGSMYHATRWGIEGFMEATATDVAAFNIGVTIIEPGRARTQFRNGRLQLAQPMQAYNDSPASRVRGVRELRPRLATRKWPPPSPTALTRVLPRCASCWEATPTRLSTPL